MQKKKCPKCGAGMFCVTAHVVQGWKVDEYGEFIETIDDCVEVAHFPDDDDLWECIVCGHNAPGEDFNV